MSQIALFGGLFLCIYYSLFIIMSLPEFVTKKVGKLPGPSLALFCGVHGNETAGIKVLDQLIQNLNIQAGTVYFVKANPQAIEQNKRQIHTNLNRLFLRNIVSQPTYEHARATELMDILDTCDALLDLHSYASPHMPEQAIPFAICETTALPIAKVFNLPYVIHGFTAIESGGSDGYMFLQNKIGICVELGSNERPELFIDLGVEIVKQFLSAYGCIPVPPTQNTQIQTHLTLSTLYKKKHDDFSFAKSFRTFDFVHAGELIAIENKKEIRAKTASYILFPRETNPIGVEVFLLAEIKL